MRMSAHDERQGNIFDICRSFHGGNENSEEANRRISKRKFGLRERILFYIKLQGSTGATCEQIEKALNLSHQTVSARCSELKQRGLVKSIGKTKTTSGCTADVLGAV